MLFVCSVFDEEVVSHLSLYIKFKDVYTVVTFVDNYVLRTIALAYSFINPNERRFS